MEMLEFCLSFNAYFTSTCCIIWTLFPLMNMSSSEKDQYSLHQAVVSLINKELVFTSLVNTGFNWPFWVILCRKLSYTQRRGLASHSGAAKHRMRAATWLTWPAQPLADLMPNIDLLTVWGLVLC